MIYFKEALEMVRYMCDRVEHTAKHVEIYSKALIDGGKNGKQI